MVGMNFDEPLMTVASLSEFFGMSEEKVREMAYEEGLYFVDCSVRGMRFLPSDVEDFVSSRRRTGRPDYKDQKQKVKARKETKKTRWEKKS